MKAADQATASDLASRLEALEARSEIARTVYKYCSQLDKRNLEGVLRLFTEDFTLSFPGWQLVVRGREEVGKYFAEQLFPTHEFNSHKVTNLDVTLEGDDAQAEAYLLLHSSYMKEPQEAVLRYDLRLRKDAGAWKLAGITCAVVYWKGSLAPQDEGVYERFTYRK